MNSGLQSSDFFGKETLESNCILVLNSWDMKKGNVENQREHLILLLANIDGRRRNSGDYTQVNLFPLRLLVIYYALYLLDHCLNFHFLFVSPLNNHNINAVGK